MDQAETEIPAQRQVRAMHRLTAAVQALSLARNLDTIMAVVRTAARELTGADGATFVLRDGDKCYYADEDAIAPLWKGQRFPMSACISGWAMLNKRPTAIPDIYADARIPADAYRPTFVKSLVMVPIRSEEPIGAIGNYWASHHQATPFEIEILQALANTTSVAMENVQVYAELEQRVHDRTLQLEAMNRELEAFSYSVSHDLRAPLRAIGGYTGMLEDDIGPQLDAEAKRRFAVIKEQTQKMSDLIEDLLRLARITRTEMKPGQVALSAIAQEALDGLRAQAPQRQAEVRVQPELEARGDAGLLKVALDNLLSNAWKYSSKRERAAIEFGACGAGEAAGQPPQPLAPEATVYFVRDDGAGFDMQYAGKLFAPFQRMHGVDEFPGTGVGLATVQRIVHRHGGQIWAHAAPGQGATFYFTLPGAG